MLQAVETLLAEPIALRTDYEFHTFINDVNNFILQHDLYELTLPRVRRPPQRYCEHFESYTHATVEEYYEAAFLK